MPRKTWNTQADWDASYSVRIRDNTHPNHRQKFGYGRIFAQRFTGPYTDSLDRFTQRRDWLKAAFSMQTTDRILIVGSAYGFLIEVFQDDGFTNIWGLEMSAHINATKGAHARAGVLWADDDLRGGGRVKSRLRQVTGDDIFKWIISEGVAESYEDAEMSDLGDASEAILDPAETNANIIHMVMDVRDVANPNASLDPVFNQKTLAEWNAIRPAHSWMSLFTGQVL